MSIARALAWPIRRLLDPRFRGLADQADSQHLDHVKRFEQLNDRIADRETLQDELTAMRRELATFRDELIAAARADMEATRETNELLGRSLGDLLTEATSTTLALDELSRAVRLTLTEGSVEDVDTDTAEFLNYASSHRGFAAQEGLWFNPPISLAYEAGGVRAADANERIVELPYVYRALARIEPGASVLDVGAAESTLAYSLASIGFETTALDLHPYPLPHPRLNSVVGDILEWESDRTFDAVVCVSTLEHLGLGAYGEPEGGDDSPDSRALERIHALTRPGGLVVVTVPFGAASANTTQRSYARADLERLLNAWQVEDLTIVRRDDSLTWVLDDADDATDDRRRVALITATRRS
jgi:2-polyprenyl-3-methyl-5-hydroxy-6-metoxy-1,4-benzoquinol methylase